MSRDWRCSTVKDNYSSNTEPDYKALLRSLLDQFEICEVDDVGPIWDCAISHESMHTYKTLGVWQ